MTWPYSLVGSRRTAKGLPAGSGFGKNVLALILAGSRSLLRWLGLS